MFKKAIITIFTIVVACFSIFYLAPNHIVNENIVSKYSKFIAAYTSTSFIQSGKVMVPVNNYHPAETDYYIATKDFNVSVDKELYDSVKENDIVTIVYKHIFTNIVCDVKKSN